MTNNIIRSAIYGMLLGDSNFHSTKKKNKGIACGHSLSQFNYLQHKVEILNTYLNSNNSIVEKTINSGYSLSTRQPFYAYYSKTSHKINQFYSILCDENDTKKRITEEGINKYFTEVSLAYLFMDDGCKETVLNDNIRTIKSYKISLGSYTIDEVHFLNEVIYKRFNIVSKVYLEHQKYLCLKITTEINKLAFKTLLEPYIIDSMKYKLFV